MGQLLNRRRLLFTVALLALGALSSVFVALGDGLLANPPHARFDPLAWKQQEPRTYNGWVTYEFRGFASRAISWTRPRPRWDYSDFPHWKPWWCPDQAESDDSVLWINVFVQGWPLPAFRAIRRSPEPGFVAIAEVLEGGVLVEQIRVPWMHDPRQPPVMYGPGLANRLGLDPPALPTRPIWIGLFANTLVHAVIWLLLIALLALPAALRRVWRRRRGRCIACAYILRDVESVRCPECGWTIGQRIPFPSKAVMTAAVLALIVMTTATAGLIVTVRLRTIEIGPMHLAARHGDVAELRRLIDAGSPVDDRAPDGVLQHAPWRAHSTPLTWAAAHGHVEAIDLLVEAGADVNAIVGPSYWWSSPLIEAVRNEQDAATKRLLELGADPGQLEGVRDGR